MHHPPNPSKRSKIEVSVIDALLSTLHHKYSSLSHETFSSCISEPHKLLVEIPSFKSPELYPKKRTAFLKSKNLTSVATCVSLQPDFVHSPHHAQYNPRLQFDMYRQSHEAQLIAACEKFPSLRSAFLILNFWIDRHQPHTTLGSFPPLALHLILVDLCEQEADVWKKASVMQLVKRALKWLSTWNGQPLRIGNCKPSKKQGFSDADFLALHPVCILSQNVVNLTFETLSTSLFLLQAEAKKSLLFQEDEEQLLLSGEIFSSFERFDLLLQMDAANQLDLFQVERLLTQALKDTGRVSSFSLFETSKKQTVLGLCVIPDAVHRLLDKGPPAEDVDASKQFQQFWGDRAELRRFKDGSVLEAVVWQPGPCIPEQIVQHVLSQHLKVPIQIHTIGLPLLVEVHGDQESLTAIDLLSALEQDIRSVSLPLAIQHVSVVNAPVLRYTKTPEKSSFLGQVLLRFESSSKWPAVEEARRKVETVLLIELAKGLEASKAYQCVVTSEGFMDVVLTANGHIFRVMLARRASDKEHELQEEEIELHAHLHSLHHSTLLGAPRSFGQVCRLVKKWLQGQAFDLSDLLVDVLVSSLFTQENPPRSGLCGLFRFFTLLSTHDWRNRPLIVNVKNNYSVSFQTRNQLDSAFFKLRETARKGGPPMVIYVVKEETDQSKTKTLPFPWGNAVDFLTLQRLVVRCKESKAYLEKLCGLGVNEAERYWSALFISDAQAGFDAVLSLATKTPVLRKRSKYQNLIPLQPSENEFVGFDVKQLLLTDLRSKYSQYANFYPGTESIGVVWKHVRMPFTIANTKFAKPCREEEGMLEVNFDEVLEEISSSYGSDVILSADKVL